MSNDGFGKGLSGGRLIVHPSALSPCSSRRRHHRHRASWRHGATGGEGYDRGVAGERFCVRNSGATVVVEGVGDHGYDMTGGRVVVLGRTGRNCRGMSGGIAHVLNLDERFERLCNREMVDLEPLVDAEDIDFLVVAIMKHLTYTGSMYAEGLLSDFATVRRHMVKDESVRSTARAGRTGEAPRRTGAAG